MSARSSDAVSVDRGILCAALRSAARLLSLAGLALSWPFDAAARGLIALERRVRG